MSAGEEAPAPAAPDAALAGELARRIAAGDPGAEAALVERYGPGLRFLLRRWTRDESTAEDLYQETLALALEKLRAGEPRDGARLAAYLRALARNLATAHYRRMGNRSDLHLPLAEAPTAPDRRSDPEGSLAARERRRTVLRVLAELPAERDRQVLLRFYLLEEEAAAVRDALGLGSEHFYRVLHRARERYRKLYAERSPGAAAERPGR